MVRKHLRITEKQKKGNLGLRKIFMREGGDEIAVYVYNGIS